MARTDPQFNLRIPTELKAKIDDSAKASGRSATAEIIARLEKSFNEDLTGLTRPTTDEMVMILKKAMEKLTEDGTISIRKTTE